MVVFFRGCKDQQAARQSVTPQRMCSSLAFLLSPRTSHVHFALHSSSPLRLPEITAKRFVNPSGQVKLFYGKSWKGNMVEKCFSLKLHYILLKYTEDLLKRAFYLSKVT